MRNEVVLSEYRNTKDGTYKGQTTYCPVNAYGDCPYCDRKNICHTDDPFEDCDDWWVCGCENWEEWEEL